MAMHLDVVADGDPPLRLVARDDCEVARRQPDLEPTVGVDAPLETPAAIVGPHLDLVEPTWIDAVRRLTGTAHDAADACRPLGESRPRDSGPDRRSEERRVGKECRSSRSPYPPIHQRAQRQSEGETMFTRKP